MDTMDTMEDFFKNQSFVPFVPFVSALQQ